MILNIIFSYNRAMQVDYLLKSAIQRFKIPNYKIVVIYHTTGDHKKGYDKLIDKYKDNLNIEFCEREKRVFNAHKYLKSFNSLRHIKIYLYYHYLKHRKIDNFKELLEGILRKTSYEYVMFNADDGYWFDDVSIPKTVLDSIKSNPKEYSYKTYVGENIEGFPDFLKKEGDLYKWDYFYSKEVTHWTSFPFVVDGTIYSTKGLLDVIQYVPFHNAITLESFVAIYARKKKLFSKGLSPITSLMVCTKLNRVSTSTYNPTVSISVAKINQKYLEGYELELELPKMPNNSSLVPNKVYFVKGETKELVYNIDEFGKKVQEALVSTGEVDYDFENNIE